MKLKKILDVSSTFIRKHRRVIATTLIITSFTGTVIQAVKDTPRANMLIDEATTDKGENLTKFETVKTYAKGYWRTILLFIFSLLLVIANSKLEAKSFASLATAYTVVEKSLNEHKDAVLEVVGEKKAEEIERKVIEKRMEEKKQPVENVFRTGNGDTLFFDCWSGRYFYSDIEAVKRAINDTNREMLESDYVSADEFYWRLGLPTCDMGSSMGWNTSMNRNIDIHLGSTLTEDDTPCCTIKFKESPAYNFDY